MMMKLKRLCLLVLTLLLACGAACADSFIPAMDFAASPLDITLRADVLKHMPLDETRLSWLNALVGHVTLRLRTQPEENRQLISLMVDESPVMEIARQTRDGASEAQLSMAPGVTMTLRGGEDVLERLLGYTPELSASALTLEHLTLMDDAEALVLAVRKACQDDIATNAKREEITGYGVATQKLTLNVTATNAEPFGRTVRSLCPEGSALGAMLQSLSFQGKQSLVLQTDRNDGLVKLTFTGVVGRTAAEVQNASVTWKLSRTETGGKDHLTVKLTPAAGSAGESVTLLLTRETKRSEQKQSVEMTATLTRRENKQDTVSKGSLSLTREDSEDMTSRLTGTLSLSLQRPESTSALAWELTPDLILAPLDGMVQGTVEVRQLYGGRVQEHALITLAMEAGAELAWHDGWQETPLDDLDEAALDELRAQVTRQAASAIIRSLVLLPAEDTLYLSAGLDDAVWQRLVETARIGQ